MQEDKRVVLLFSGGVDSTVLFYKLIGQGYDVYPLYVNYGQSTYSGEIRATERIVKEIKAKPLMIIDIPNIGSIGGGSLIRQYPDDMSSTEEWNRCEFFPNRNLLLLTLASMYANKIKINNIAIGVVGHSYNDTSSEFIKSMTNLLEISLGKFNIIAPYAEKERETVIKDAKNLNVNIERTFSCNALGDRHCLLCTSCLERVQAFHLLNDLS